MRSVYSYNLDAEFRRAHHRCQGARDGAATFLYRGVGVASDEFVLENAINSAAVLHLSVAATIRVYLALGVGANRKDCRYFDSRRSREGIAASLRPLSVRRVNAMCPIH